MERRDNRRDLKVYIRFLPSMQISRENVKYNLETNTIYLRCKDAVSQRNGQRPSSPQFWSFHPHKVFYNASQDDVYGEVAEGILESSVLTGTDAVIMAFGQVGSGKTFSMIGIRSKLYQRGLVPRFISNIMQMSNRKDMKVGCEMSFIEIIGQKITDLFTGKQVKLEDLKRVPRVLLTSNRCSLNKLFQAESRRNVAGHAKSGNRGHGIITFYIRTLDLLASNAEYKLVRVHFVDLAGIDTFVESQGSGKKATEIGKANITKSFLDQCVHQLEKPPIHVVSDLAIRFLSNSLSNGSTLRFIGHVKMTESDLAVSLSLLRFAARMAGTKFEKKTSDPSSPHHRNVDTLKSLVGRVQLEAMLRNCTDDVTLEGYACKERVAFLRSKTLKRLEKDVSAKKTEGYHLDDRKTDPLGVYDPPIPTDFNFERDPMFNYHNCTPEEFTLQYGSHPRMRSQNELQTQIESRAKIKSKSTTGSRSKVPSRTRASRGRLGARGRGGRGRGSKARVGSRAQVESRLRFESAPKKKPRVVRKVKTGSLLQNLVSLKTTQGIALQTTADIKTYKAELSRLFLEKLDRARNTSELGVVPPSISRSATVVSKRMPVIGFASQGTMRRTSTKKGGSTKNFFSMSGIAGMSHEELLKYRELNSTPPLREIDDCGVSIGPGGTYAFQGRIAMLTKQARAAEKGRRPLLKKMRVNPVSSNKLDEAAEITEFVVNKQMIPIAPAPSLSSIDREAEASANRRLSDAKEELAQRQTDYFQAMRRLEWCRYLFGRAHCDLREVQERRRSLGADSFKAEGEMATSSKEARLAEVINSKRQEFVETQQEILSHHEAVNLALIKVAEAQENLDAFLKEMEIQRPDISALMAEEGKEDDEDPPTLCLFNASQKHS